ncbi:AmpG family muropeptide MFS transporter [Terrihabitans rhizophilus]|uniref:MFS transporter n=1 Tax=Terrihabitans rhizophilus TaxID=3092662 RepID=A0ABU4RI28_9HYPH|nr:MFS transporter [Terrihabitans sp. PJ23]MDX6804485.1 MFS transporter [Terrihabitans sp. PJ23]
MSEQETDRAAAKADGGIAAFLQRRTLVMLGLGFSAGLPNLLIFDTLSAWLRDDGVSLSVIGFFSLATLAYSAKFLWAPLVDRARIPLLTDWLGHRRSWMLSAQFAVILGLWLISGLDPAADLGLMALFAVFVGFSGATQDIVIDAWRIEVAEDRQQGVMAAAYQWGYRLAMIVAGALPLILAQHFSWNLSYAVMAGLMGIGIAAVLLAPREREHVLRPVHTEGVAARPFADPLEWAVRGLLFLLGAFVAGAGLSGDPTTLVLLTRLVGSEDAFGLAGMWRTSSFSVLLQISAVVIGLALLAVACVPQRGRPTRPGVFLSASFGAPLADFFRRYAGSAALILALICLYRVSDFVLNIMNPFYLDLGFTKTEIAEVRKVFGVVASMGGVFLGGLAVIRLGLMRALVIGAFAGAISNLCFIYLAMMGHSVPALYFAIGVDNLCSGFSGTCLIAYMSSLTSGGFTATQYALFSSLYALPGKLIASQSGRIIEGAAHSAENGGLASGLRRLFTGTTPESYIAGALQVGTSPAALGAGYVTFFLYSTLIGVAAIVLTIIVARRSAEAPVRDSDPAERAQAYKSG